ncbi:MAG: hypothetical protein ACI9KE_005945 [Polyangiales bacterium]|jgi:hypothetical protein
MSRSRSSSSPDTLRSHLETKKAKLDANVDALSQRRFLSSGEQLSEKEMKKRKLVMKDALSRL